MSGMAAQGELTVRIDTTPAGPQITVQLDAGTLEALRRGQSMTLVLDEQTAAQAGVAQVVVTGPGGGAADVAYFTDPDADGPGED